jgi:parvulin-like peptidyl-prolyl isomerase
VTFANDRRPGFALFEFALAAALIGWTGQANAQDDGQEKFKLVPPAPRMGQSGRATTPKKTVRVDDIPAPELRATQIPVNPTDPIIIINGQVITRQQLADECVARKGKEVAELMINRTLVEQALRAKKLEVTAAEIDQEINTVAGRFGVGRDNWLRTLDKERGISPMQYARDIIYPAIALRKLCAGRVQVTPNDMQQAFEAQYSEKIRCRMILVDTQHKATAIWEELRKNPGGFEKIAMEQSMDTASRSLGGLIGDPITRHAYPQTLTDAAFRQLVDGDPADRDPSHKPKDGAFTGPIQVSEMVWVILRRESLDPAVKGYSLKDEKVRKQTYEMIYEVKLKETMGAIMQELIRSAAIENQLTGTVKLADEEKHPEYGVDGDVNLMSNPPATKGAPKPGTVSGAMPRGKNAAAPVGLAPETVREFERIKSRPRSGSAASSNDATSSPPAGSN